MCIENPLCPSIMTLWLVVFNTLFFFLILLSNCLLFLRKKRLGGDFLLKRRDLPTAFSHDNMEKRLWWSQLLSSKEAATSGYVIVMNSFLNLFQSYTYSLAYSVNLVKGCRNSF